MNMPDLGGMAGKSSPDFLMRRLAALEAKVRQLETARSLEAATIGRGGITVEGGGGLVIQSGGGVTIDSGGTLTLEGGDIVADGGDVRSGNFAHGVSGFKLDGTTGTPEFNDLILRGGIVGNDALTSPVVPGVWHAQASNFGLTTTATQKVDITATVPAGFTRAVVLATISATAVNTTSAQDTFLGYADVDFVGSPGGYLAGADAAPNFAAGIAHTETALPTGLGGTLHLRGMLQSLNAAWPANAFNTINLDVLALFLR